MTPEALALTHAAAFVDTRPWSAREFAGFLNDTACFIAGDPSAFALVRVVLDEAELLTIATHPDVQRQGRARHLMGQWQAQAAERGARTAFLEVAADNHAARALYADCGYVQSGLRPGYYTQQDLPPVDAILMARQLP